jgi:hypothetical protein
VNAITTTPSADCLATIARHQTRETPTLSSFTVVLEAEIAACDSNRMKAQQLGVLEAQIEALVPEHIRELERATAQAVGSAHLRLEFKRMTARQNDSPSRSSTSRGNSFNAC